MNANRMTERSVEALRDAQIHAIRAGHQEFGAAHLLLALLDQPDGLVRAVLKRAKVDVALVAGAARKVADRQPRVTGSGVEAGKVYVTPDLQQALVKAEEEASRLGDSYVSVEHLFLGLISSNPQMRELLGDQGVTYEGFLAELKQVRGNHQVTSPTPEGIFDALEKYGVDLVAQAREAKLDPVICRDAEIRRVIRILSRKTKNNPVADWRAGRGKDSHRRRPGSAYCSG